MNNAVDTLPTIQASQAQESIKNLPVSLFGAVMGLAGVCLGWRLASPMLRSAQIIAESFGLVALLLFGVLAAGYLAKALLYPAAVAAEFNHPVAGNFFGTIAIATLLLSAVIAPYSGGLGRFVWSVGVILTLGLTFVVVSRLLSGGLDTSLAVPAWLVPGVAALDITVTGADVTLPWAHQTNLLGLGIGSALAVVFFTMIMSRLIHRQVLAAPMLPSSMILIAPFEVGFLAYSKFTGKADDFAALLFFFGLFLFTVVSVRLVRIRPAFSVGWWAIGFPVAALANAAMTYAMANPAWPLFTVAWVILVLLSISLMVLAVRTIHILFNGTLLKGA